MWYDYELIDEDWPIMRKKFKPEFFKEYNFAFENYVRGEWIKAKEIFEKAEEILGEKDGPTRRILNIMQEYNYLMPSDYKFGG